MRGWRKGCERMEEGVREGGGRGVRGWRKGCERVEKGV